jgi:hypothetical protein
VKPCAHAEFWKGYHALSPQIRPLADKQFVRWLEDAGHPSLNFKKVGRISGRRGWMADIVPWPAGETDVSPGFGLAHTTNTNA